MALGAPAGADKHHCPVRNESVATLPRLQLLHGDGEVPLVGRGDGLGHVNYHTCRRPRVCHDWEVFILQGVCQQSLWKDWSASRHNGTPHSDHRNDMHLNSFAHLSPPKVLLPLGTHALTWYPPQPIQGNGIQCPIAASEVHRSVDVGARMFGRAEFIQLHPALSRAIPGPREGEDAVMGYVAVGLNTINKGMGDQQ